MDASTHPYTILYTVDASGSRSAHPDGWIDSFAPTVQSAAIRADELTREGRCGYVRRESDGAVLAQDGTWTR